MIPHMGFLGVSGEDIWQGIFKGNDQKAGLHGRQECLGG